jgi:hypothetical protein
MMSRCWLHAECHIGTAAEGTTLCADVTPALPLSSPKPKFEAESIHAIEVVAEQPLVSYKAQILIQPQCRPICDLSFKYNLERKGAMLITSKYEEKKIVAAQMY